MQKFSNLSYILSDLHAIYLFPGGFGNPMWCQIFVKLQPKPKAKRLGVDFVLPPSQQQQSQSQQSQPSLKFSMKERT